MEKEKKKGRTKWLLWIITILVLVVIISSVNSGDKKYGNGKTAETSSQTNIPIEYKNALKKAENYSKTMHMSKKGIYDQLTSEYGEQFNEEAAQYAIDNMNVNWEENALEKAKTYQNSMSMSKNAIYDQLISEYGEQFTEEEAQYAIEHLDN